MGKQISLVAQSIIDAGLAAAKRKRMDKSAFFGVGNGLPGELDRLAACGNAVVPQIPELIGRAILQTLGKEIRV